MNIIVIFLLFSCIWCISQQTTTSQDIEDKVPTIYPSYLYLNTHENKASLNEEEFILILIQPFI